MAQNKRTWIVILLLFIAAGYFLWNKGCRRSAPPPTPVVTIPEPPPHVKTVPEPLPVKTKAAAPKTTTTGAPIPPKLELHTELIPKNIEIVRCYYTQEVAPPGKTIGFDINGSGFTDKFEKMIQVESGHDDVRIKNLHLVTTNQIHGELEIGKNAKTGFVYPRVLIKDLPVFSAPDPFAVVRRGEVLTVFFVSMEEDGRGGNFRVITNIDEGLVKSFVITPSTSGIKVDNLRPQLPYLMEGHMQITPGVPPGEHGLIIRIAGKKVFDRMGMIRIVRPNVGQFGFIQNLVAEEKYHRPGDDIQIYVQGTGMTAQDVTGLDAKVTQFNFGPAQFTYVSPVQLRMSMKSPGTTPVGIYTVQIFTKADQKQLFIKENLFHIVPANWVAGVQVTPPVAPGRQSQLKIMGRDFSPDFVSSFRIDVDEPRITITNLRQVNEDMMTADIRVAPGVAAGDYWLHLSAKDGKVTPPFGSIIKVVEP